MASLYYESPEVMRDKIEEWFTYMETSTIDVFARQLNKHGEPVPMSVRRPYTVEGLARYLGLTRTSLNNYQKREEYKDYIEAAKERIIQDTLERAMVGSLDSPTVRLWIVNNSSYKNEKSVDHTSAGEKITAITIQ
jgi:hypothetical protein